MTGRAMTIRYRNFDDERLQEVMDDLVEGQISGVASITQNGETITFRGPAEIEKQIQAVEKEIQRREDVAAGITRKRSYVSYPRTSKGWH
jgi:dihydrodipicolinate synthase/N-acetylneuraminate lyase